MFREYLELRRESEIVPETMAEYIAVLEGQCMVYEKWLTAAGIDCSAETVTGYLISGEIPDTLPVQDIHPYDDIWVYLPEQQHLVSASEGTGDNLLPEDKSAGYVDYVEYTVYSLEDSCEPEDGGEWMLRKMLRESYPDMRACIPDLLECIYGEKDMAYIVLPSQWIIKQEETYEKIRDM